MTGSIITSSRFIIEGIDRIGKDTLIENLQQEFGFYHLIHYLKPKKLKFFGFDERRFQEEAFNYGFSLLSGNNCRFIFNRFHLGEYVYGPYRHYSGEYVFELERDWMVRTYSHVRLVLLHHQKPEVLVDDGESLAFDKRVEEQEKFVEAFERSTIPNKVIVEVADEQGSFRDPQAILNDAINGA